MTDTLTPENLSPNTEDSTLALFSARQVSLAAFLGGALGGGWLMFKNFGAIGDEAQKKTAVFGSLLLTAIIAVGAMLLPTDFSNSLIPLITVGIFAAWYHFKLESVYSAHREGGGAQASWWKTIGLGAVGFAASLVVFFIVALSVPILPVNHVQDGQNIIYYEGDATRENAESLAKFFHETGVFNPSASWELTLLFPKHDPRRVVIKLPYPAEIEGTPAHEEVKALATLLDDEKYAVKDVEIHIQNAFGLITFVVRNE